mmetsp:Transcript_95840/g.228273  ORF Transcript_95840/g.228273 Transcript_95840/m.228273 type:complete len:252 (-) Transcript_95840:1212-1967(-)
MGPREECGRYSGAEAGCEPCGGGSAPRLAHPGGCQVLHHLRCLLPRVYERWHELLGDLLLLLLPGLCVHGACCTCCCMGRHVRVLRHHLDAAANRPDPLCPELLPGLHLSLLLSGLLCCCDLHVLQALGKPGQCRVLGACGPLPEGLLVPLLPARLPLQRAPDRRGAAAVLPGGALCGRLWLGEAHQPMVAKVAARTTRPPQYGSQHQEQAARHFDGRCPQALAARGRQARGLGGAGRAFGCESCRSCIGG